MLDDAGQGGSWAHKKWLSGAFEALILPIVIQIAFCVTVNSIADILESNSLLFKAAPKLSHGQFLLSIFLVKFFFNHPFDMVETFLFSEIHTGESL